LRTHSPQVVHVRPYMHSLFIAQFVHHAACSSLLGDECRGGRFVLQCACCRRGALYTHIDIYIDIERETLQDTATHCAMQHTTTHQCNTSQCKTLQHIARHCNTLRNASHYNTSIRSHEVARRGNKPLLKVNMHTCVCTVVLCTVVLVCRQDNDSKPLVLECFTFIGKNFLNNP